MAARAGARRRPDSRRPPPQTKLYCLVQQHAVSFVAHTKANTGPVLPRFIKDEFYAFFERDL